MDYIFNLGQGNIGALEVKKCHTFFSNSAFLLSSKFLDFIGQFLQPPAWAHIQAEPSLSSSLRYGYNTFILGFGILFDTNIPFKCFSFVLQILIYLSNVFLS